MSDDELVLIPLKKSRKAIKAGDLFRMKTVEGKFYFGRVINPETNIANMDNTILCYVYSASSDDGDSIPNLSKDDLLIPPFGIDKSPWSRSGCFETIRNEPLLDGDVREKHIFKNPLRDVFYDEYENETQYSGDYFSYSVLHNDITIDWNIGKALGLVND